MKKTIWIIGLIIITFLGDRASAWLLEKFNLSSQFRYSRLYADAAEAEILLLGNSRGLIFYQPFIEELTQKSTFNFSYNALSIDIAKCLVEDYLDRYQTAKQLIIDISMCDRENDQLISSFGTYRNQSNRLTTLLKEKTPKSYYGGLVSHLFNFNSEVFHRSLYYSNKTDETWLLDRVITQNLIDNFDKSSVPGITSSDYILEQLVSTIQIAEQRGLTVKLVLNPYYRDYAQEMATLPTFIKNIEVKTGKKVHDFSKVIEDTNSFGDFQHLNKQGSQQYMEHLFKSGIFDTKVN